MKILYFGGIVVHDGIVRQRFDSSGIALLSHSQKLLLMIYIHRKQKQNYNFLSDVIAAHVKQKYTSTKMATSHFISFQLQMYMRACVHRHDVLMLLFDMNDRTRIHPRIL